MNIKEVIKITTISIALSISLSGCFGAILGVAAVGGTALIDRRATGAQTDDNIMEIRIRNAAASYLSKSTDNQNKSTVSIVSYNRRVLLLGLVASEQEKAFVEQIARSQQSTQEVYNYIQVVTDDRSWGDVTTDTWGTTKIRTMLLGVKNVYPGYVKVVTYNQVAYVMGLLTPEEQAAVTEKVRTTSGVTKVVTLYENYEK